MLPHANGRDGEIEGDEMTGPYLLNGQRFEFVANRYTTRLYWWELDERAHTALARENVTR